MADNDLIAEQVYHVLPTDTGLVSIDFDKLLPDGVLLTGTPSVTELAADGSDAGSGDLTFSSITRNTEVLEILGRNVAVDEAVQFVVSGFLVANSPYYIRVSCGFDDGQDRGMYVKLVVPDLPTKA